MRDRADGSAHYRCEATSVAAFVQQLAVGYIARGYWFYVVGRIPEGKDPRAVDAKLISRYGLAVSKWARARRRRGGTASVQYLRLGRIFILAATHGTHPFFIKEPTIADIRRVPLKVSGYSIGYSPSTSGGHVSVRIEREHYKQLKRHSESIALRSIPEIVQWLRSLPFEPYAPIRGQIDSLVRTVNRIRKLASLELVSHTAIYRVRIPVQVFCKSP